jgi:peptidyl-prolyl cis-trans isomerase C
MRPCLRFLRLAALASAGMGLAASAMAQQPAAQPPKPATSVPVPPAAQAQPPAQAPKDPVVATVNGQQIRLSDVEALQQNLPPQYRSMPVQAVLPALLDRLVDSKLVALEARKAKVQDEAAFKKRMSFIEEQVMQEFWVQREIAKRVTPEKMRERYLEKVKAAPPDEEVKARHILVSTEDEAKAVIAELKKGTAFEKLARDKSTDKASGAEGGDLGWFKKSDMVPEFATAAFNMKKGELSDAPIKTQFGWHIIQLDDRRAAAPPSFEEASEQLREDMTRETVQALLAQLRSTAKVEKFNADGSKVDAAPASGPPAAPAPAPPAATPAKPK